MRSIAIETAATDTAYNTGLMSSHSGATASLTLEMVEIDNPTELNFILGHAHFIKTVEDLYEALVQSSTALKFGIAFNEASEGNPGMPGRKVRFDGNHDALIELAKKNAMALGAGHTFIVFIDGGFPVNCLNAIKAVPEVCHIYCATANPTKAVIAKLSENEKVSDEQHMLVPT
eukprot:jgi/Chrzof1/169/Cz01g05260.t1